MRRNPERSLLLASRALARLKQRHANPESRVHISWQVGRQGRAQLLVAEAQVALAELHHRNGRLDEAADARGREADAHHAVAELQAQQVTTHAAIATLGSLLGLDFAPQELNEVAASYAAEGDALRAEIHARNAQAGFLAEAGHEDRAGAARLQAARARMALARQPGEHQQRVGWYLARDR
jgi:hypothetical protein